MTEINFVPEFTVNVESEGQRLDRFLVSVLGDHSRSQIQKLIADGHVRVAARDAKPNLAVREGDRIVVDVPAAAPATVQAEPMARRLGGLSSFVTVKGGAYFFLPGINALKFLLGVQR